MTTLENSMKRSALFLISIAVFSASCNTGHDQEPEITDRDITLEENQRGLPGKGMETSQRWGDYPRLMEDGSVLFALNAPGASQVSLVLPCLGSFCMNSDGNGIWTLKSAPLEPGFHYYWYDVDGLEISDPASVTYHGYGHEVSAVEIPEEGTGWYDFKNVPHGRVSEIRYVSKVTGCVRKLCVYTPAGYEKHLLKKYPVIYIGHGTGENQRSWMEQGKAGIILDNLIAEGKAEPMIAVTMSSHLYDSPAEYSTEGMKEYEEELLHSIIPFIDRTFRTRKNRENRALCGLSQGSGEAFYIGLRHPDTFSAIGMFSCGLFGKLFAAGADMDDVIPGLISEAGKYNEAFPVIYFSCGEGDCRITDYEHLTSELKQAGLLFTYETFPGGHEWQPWRKSLHNFAGMLFRR